MMNTFKDILRHGNQRSCDFPISLLAGLPINPHCLYMSQEKVHRLDLERKTHLPVGGTYQKTLSDKSPRTSFPRFRTQTRKVVSEKMKQGTRQVIDALRDLAGGSDANW